jgi:hypothetical protein
VSRQSMSGKRQEITTTERYKIMKIRTLMTVIFATAALAGAAEAKQPVPFKGVLAAVENDVVEPPTLFVDLSGTGQATHLGRFTLTFQAQVDPQTLIGVGTMRFVAANGDTILATFIGQATPTSDPTVLSLVESATITGGTGRFAGATGSFTQERTLHLDTGISSGTFNGTILFKSKN